MLPWSVRTAVKRDLSKWRSENKYYKRHKPTLMYRELLFSTEHPARLIVSLVTLSVALFFLWRMVVSGLVGQGVRHWTRPLDRFAHFTGLWAIQATVAALVFPIVIAFVTIFLQRRAATRAFVQLYLLDSAALVAGLSALLLVVVMAAQYVLIPLLGKKNLLVFTQIDAAWFVLNSALTAYFLLRTIEFLRPEIQERVLQRYTIGVALPRDIQRTAATYVLLGAVKNGLVPGSDLLGTPDARTPGVAFFSLGLDEGVVQLKQSFASPRVLHDARFLPLRMLVSGWLKKAKRYSAPPGVNRHRAQVPRLVLPLTVGDQYIDDVELAVVETGPGLNLWQRCLLRAVYVFRQLPKRYHLRVNDILFELEADARESIAARDVPSFERAYKTLVALHLLLIGASVSTDTDVESWALLSDQTQFLGLSFHRSWAKSYRSIIQAAVDGFEVEPRPLRNLVYLSSHLSGDELAGSPTEMRKEAVRLSVFLMHRLAHWWTRKAEEQGALDAGPNKLVRLRPPYRRLYDEALNDFVGGWEAARRIADIPKAGVFDWSHASDTAAINAFHIEETAKMMLGAVSRGDAEAAEWFADVLSKWWGSFSYEDDFYALYGKTEFLTLEHLSLPWPELLGAIGVNESLRVEGGDGELQRFVLLAAIKNYWTDIRFIVVELLLAWAAESSSPSLKQSLAAQIATGLLEGRVWRPGGIQSDPLSEIDAAGFLQATLRQAVGGTASARYVHRIDGFIEAVRDMQRPDMVSGRTYEGVGIDQLGSLAVAQVVLLILLSDSNWRADESTLRQLDIWIAQGPMARDSVERLLRQWRPCLDEGRSPQRLVEILVERLRKPQNFEVGTARVQAVLDALAAYFEQHHAEAIARAEIDPGRLSQIARFASSRGFTAATGDFPLQMFDSIVHENSEASPYTLTMTQVRKGELTAEPLEQRAINKADFWAKQMASYVGAVVLGDVLSTASVRSIPTPDAESYWGALKREAAKIRASDQQPILILGKATTPEWVWQWQHPSEDDEFRRPEDLNVYRVAGRGDGYVCDFNDIHVYAAPLPTGQSVLIAKSAFNRLKFRRFEPERFVSAEAVARDDTTQLVDLKLQFQRSVAVGEGAILRLIYTRKET